jgi:hypothetical protein
MKLKMKKILCLPALAFSLFGMPSAFAANPMVRCSVAYYDANGIVHHEGTYKMPGQLSVDDCVQIAIAVKKVTPHPIAFKYFHYNNTSGGSLASDNDGWELSSVIWKAKEKPTKMTYANFSNP